jgi:Outer membrane lipoprotein-sorting protein
MKSFSPGSLALAVALALASAPASAQSATEIMARVDARDDGDNRIAILDMILIDRRGNERRRRVRTFSKDRGRDTLTMMFFLAPADVRRTGFLTYDYDGGARDDDQWLYLPELRKTKRIASTDKSAAFMGTDFSYADMTRRVLDEWSFRLLREDELRSRKVWLIEALPVSDVVRDRYGYSKSVLFVRQDIFMVVRAVNWVKGGRRLKYFDIRKLERIDGIWVGTELDMKTTRGRKTVHRTIFRFSDVKYGQDLDENLFSIRRLEQGP